MIIMAAVEVGAVQQVKHFNTDGLISFLNKNGISQTGLKSLRDNQVEGEMLLEFTDADLKDIFEVFKDRFLIRKLLRGLYGPNNSPYHLVRPIAPTTQMTQGVVQTSTTTTTPIFSSSHTTISAAPANFPKITSEPLIDRITLNLQNPPKPQHVLESYPKTLPHVITSNSQKVTSLNAAVTSDSLTPRVKMHINNIRSSQLFTSNLCTPDKPAPKLITMRSTSVSANNVTNSNTPIYSSPNTLETSTTPVRQTEIQTHVIEDDDPADNDPADNDPADNEVHVIDGWGASRIKDFTAEELLRRKVRRGRPTEAQRLGRSQLREAATTANIWSTAPPLKLIPADKKEMFFRYICHSAPQLSRHKQFVWIRLGEALQNRRKYLSDKECGRRSTKRKRDSEIAVSPPPLLSSVAEQLINNFSSVTSLSSSTSTLSTLSSSSTLHLSSSSSSVKNELQPIIIDSSDQDNSHTLPSPTGLLASPIETINLTTLIKEEAESEGIKYWPES